MPVEWNFSHCHWLAGRLGVAQKLEVSNALHTVISTTGTPGDTHGGVAHRSRPKRTLSNMPVAFGIASFRPQVSSTSPGPTHTKYSIEVLGSHYLDDNVCLFFSRLVRSQDSADVRIVYLTVSTVLLCQ